MSGIVLVLGASGRFGRHAAEAFWNKGWQVRLFDRGTDDLKTAAEDVDVIVNGWNPPYNAWAREVPKLTQAIISAAKINDATVLIPGNIYGYGKGADGLISIATPKQATNPLGRIRNDMEEAFRVSGVKTIILRAGNFVDTEASGNWFDKVIVASVGKGQIVAPGDVDCPQSWGYLPDMARAAVLLADKRNALDDFQEILFPGFTMSLQEMARYLETATGMNLRIKRMSWLPLWIARPFWPLATGLLEMRYLWSMPHWLDSADIDRHLPNFATTDPLTALAHAIGQFNIDPNQPVSGGALDIATE